MSIDIAILPDQNAVVHVAGCGYVVYRNTANFPEIPLFLPCPRDEVALVDAERGHHAKQPEDQQHQGRAQADPSYRGTPVYLHQEHACDNAYGDRQTDHEPREGGTRRRTKPRKRRHVGPRDGQDHHEDHGRTVEGHARENSRFRESRESPHATPPRSSCFARRCDTRRLVGAAGFEPATLWSQTTRASQTALRPDSSRAGRGNAAAGTPSSYKMPGRCPGLHLRYAPIHLAQAGATPQPARQAATRCRGVAPAYIGFDILYSACTSAFQALRHPTCPTRRHPTLTTGG